MYKLVIKLRSSLKCKRVLTFALLFFLALYVFSIPSFSNRDVYNLVTYAIMAIFALITLLYCILYRGFKIHPASLLIPVFVAFAFIGTTIYSKNFRGWFSLVLLAISLILFIYSFSAIKDRFVVLRAISIGLFFFTVYFIFVYRSEIIDIRNFGRGNFRLGEIFDNPNGIASYMVIAFGVSLSVFLFGKRKIDLLFVFPILTSCLVGFSTGSKTFLLAIFIFTAVLLFFKFIKRKWIYLIVLIGLIGIGILLISLPFMETIRERFVHFFQTLLGTAEKADTSSLSRLMWMKYGFYLGGKNIIFGYGYGGFSIYSGVGAYTHSNISEVFCNFGVIGMLLFYSPLFICLIKSIIEKRINLSLVIPFFVYYILVSFSNVFYYNKTYYLMVALITYCCFEEDKIRSVFKTKTELNKIVFTCDSMGSGGAERVISILSKNFVNNGYDVKILMISNHEISSFYQLDEKVNLDCLCKNESNKVNTFKRIHLLRKYLKDEKPSVVISFLPHVSVYTYIANLGLDIHHIVSERSNPEKNPKRKLLRFLKKISFRHSDGGVFQSNFAKNYFGKTVSYKGVVINNPICLGNRKTNFENTNYTVVSTGRLEPEKNTDLLIESFNIALKYNQKLRLKIYGEGSLERKLIDKILSLNCKDRIVLMGNNTNWLQESLDDTVFVLSSDYEGMPNALFEALLSGIPCIATRCPCGITSEIIKDGENGFLVDCNNPEQMAKSIIKVIDMGKDVRIISEKNIELIEQFDEKNITNQWISYMKMVLNNDYGK